MPPTPPPRDANGDVEPHDHKDIHSGDFIARRISTQHIVQDQNGVRRVSTLAFSPSSGHNGGMSIDLIDCVARDGGDPVRHVTSPQWIGAVSLSVDFLRSQDLLVGYDPLPSNIYHGEVWGRFTKSVKRNLLANAEWFVPIPDVEL